MYGPHYSRNHFFRDVTAVLEDDAVISRSSFYVLLKKEELSHIRSNKREKGLCDCLLTKRDVTSRARLIVLKLSFQNHIVLHRMARHMYNVCIEKLQGREKSEHLLESTLLATDVVGDESVQQKVLDELQRLTADGKLES